MNVVHIESRRSKRRNSEFEIAVDIQCDDNRMSELINALEKEVAAVKLVDFDHGLSPPMSPAISVDSFGQNKRYSSSHQHLT